MIGAEAVNASFKTPALFIGLALIFSGPAVADEDSTVCPNGHVSPEALNGLEATHRSAIEKHKMLIETRKRLEQRLRGIPADPTGRKLVKVLKMDLKNLDYHISRAEVSVAKAYLRKAVVSREVAPGSYSALDVDKLRHGYRLKELRLQRLLERRKPPEEQTRLPEIEMEIAKSEVALSDLLLSQVRSLPPGTISESDFEDILTAANNARSRLSELEQERKNASKAINVVP